MDFETLLCLATVNIALAEYSYSILIGTDLLHTGGALTQLPAAAQTLIVTNTTVAPRYAEPLRAALAAHYLEVLPDGEEHKTWQTLNLTFDTLLTQDCDRKTVMFALGGGVIGDTTGFAAVS